MGMLWSNMALRLLDKLPMNRCHSFRLQQVPIVLIRLVTFLKKHSPSYWLKKFEKVWWCFLWSVTSTLSFNKFHCLSLHVQIGFICIFKIVFWISSWCADLSWRWLIPIWRGGNRELRAVWYCNYGWRNVWIYDRKCILATLTFGRV